MDDKRAVATNDERRKGTIYRALTNDDKPSSFVQVSVMSVTAASGNVIVAPNVLVRLMSLAIREVPGVARLGSAPRAGLRSGKSGAGVVAHIGADGVSADCYLIALAETNLLELGVAVQATVAAVIQELAGMTVREVNVYIQDVEAGSG